VNECQPLVPGDIVCLGAGAAIPADCVLRTGKPIQVGFKQ